MGFMTRYAGTEKVDVTDLGPDDGTEYWVEIRSSLSGDEWDRADALHVKTAANMKIGGKAGRAAREAAAKRRAAMANGDGQSDDDDLTALLSFDTPAYRSALLLAAIVSWNLTDEFGRELPLKDKDGRAASIRKLPGEVRDRLFELIEAGRPKKRSKEDDADFPDDLPVGGEAGEIGASADPGDLDEGGLVVAHWADAGDRPISV
jgi:hypothetical protein